MRATSEDEIRKKNILIQLPFGGFKMLFSGDFYQLPPVRDDPLYQPLPSFFIQQQMVGKPNKMKCFEGRKLWERISAFHTLNENFRCRVGPDGQVPVLAQFSTKTRIGEPDRHSLKIINDKCLAIREPTHMDPRALWMAASRKKVGTLFAERVAVGAVKHRT